MMHGLTEQRQLGADDHASSSPPKVVNLSDQALVDQVVGEVGAVAGGCF